MQEENNHPIDSLLGVHHVTAMTSSAERIYDFFTRILGMRLVKKTVNQDDIQTYHLFFADDQGNAGTDMTFFDFPNLPKGMHGTNEISRTSFRVPDDAALAYWEDRFKKLGVEHGKISKQFGRLRLPFVDFDGQRYQLISDEIDQGVAGGLPWKLGPVPKEYAILGLGPVHLSVGDFIPLRKMLTSVFKMRESQQEGRSYWFEMGEGGNGASIIVEHDAAMSPSRQGYGLVHHAAFRVRDGDHLDQWITYLQDLGLPNSGFVDRFFFQSLYVPVAPGILFEIATDGPGFMGDEPYETLGERLSLPPFLEPHRASIEKRVRPIDTVWSGRGLDSMEESTE